MKASEEKITKWVLVISCCMVLVFIVMEFNGYGSGEKKYDKDLTDWKTVITPEEYRQLEIDMSYEEVRDIIGGDGKLIESKEMLITYGWPGEYYIDDDYWGCYGYIEVCFSKHTDDDETLTVDWIEENEIVEGKECYDTIMKELQGKYSELDTPLTTDKQKERVRNGMNYGQVCAIMKGEGALYESKRLSYGSGKIDITKEYLWRRGTEHHQWYTDVRFRNGVVDWMY